MKIDFEKYSGRIFSLIFACAALFTGLLFMVLWLFNPDSYIRSFFFRCWYVQCITTYLFFAAIFFVVSRFILLKTEKRILSQKVALERLEGKITPDLAKDMLEAIDVRYQHAISFRRLSELLWAYLHGEELVRLNQELSRKDSEKIEGGHLILNALKQLIPVLGFLGTVVGLSLGMAKFPELSETAGNIDNLRTVLKDLSASLGVSFDTTLLALGYTIVVVLLTSFLRWEEERFVMEVDDKARHLIGRLTISAPAAGTSEPQLERALKGFVDNLQSRLDQVLQGLAQDLKKNVGDLVKKLEDLKDGIQNLPHYEITVQPVKGRSSEK